MGKGAFRTGLRAEKRVMIGQCGFWAGEIGQRSRLTLENRLVVSLFSLEPLSKDLNEAIYLTCDLGRVIYVIYISMIA
jgi:hypothetical protein